MARWGSRLSLGGCALCAAPTWALTLQQPLLVRHSLALRAAPQGGLVRRRDATPTVGRRYLRTCTGCQRRSPPAAASPDRERARACSLPSRICMAEDAETKPDTPARPCDRLHTPAPVAEEKEGTDWGEVFDPTKCAPCPVSGESHHAPERLFMTPVMRTCVQVQHHHQHLLPLCGREIVLRHPRL